MTTRELSALIGKQLTLTDARTGMSYQAAIHDAISQYGRLRVTCDGTTWFEATAKELEGGK